MSTTKPESSGPEDEADAADEADSDLESRISALRLANDVDGLLALAKQYRAGTGGVPRDMRACLEAYLAAAELGSATAQHAAGLFHLNGGVVARDEKQAALQFRAAADQGHLPAKVLLANFYELGIHYRADAAKADVWYRNAARTAGVEHEPGTAEYAKALADLGAVRYCLELAQAKETPEPERARLMKVARTYGYRPTNEAGRDSDVPRPSVVTADALGSLDDSRGAGATKTPITLSGVGLAPTPKADPAKVAAPIAKATEPAATKKPVAKPGPKVDVGLGATAFLFSLVFAAVGLVLGHVLRNLGLEKLEAGESLPVVGRQVEAILPLFVGFLAVLPNLLVYRLAAFVRAALVGIAAAIAGEVLWGLSQHFLETRVMQITDFGAGGLLVGLLIFGIFGGAKPGSR